MTEQDQKFVRFNQSLISYVKKTLFLGSKEFYRKFAKKREQELLTLDAPVASGNNMNFVDTIVDPSADVIKEVCKHSTDIRDYLDNKRLLQAMECLNDKELHILYKLFVEEKNGVEIGRELEVSKQYITKIKGQAFKKIRNYLRIEVE